MRTATVDLALGTSVADSGRWRLGRSSEGGAEGGTVKLAQAHALWESGQLATEELPEVAVEALVAGIDTPSLRVLAGLPAGRMSRAVDLLDRALQELGQRPMVRLPPAREAALWAEATAAGAIKVFQGVIILRGLSPRSEDAELQGRAGGVRCGWPTVAAGDPGASPWDRASDHGPGASIP